MRVGIILVLFFFHKKNKKKLEETKTNAEMKIMITVIWCASVKGNKPISCSEILHEHEQTLGRKQKVYKTISV